MQTNRNEKSLEELRAKRFVLIIMQHNLCVLEFTIYKNSPFNVLIFLRVYIVNVAVSVHFRQIK